jgi:pimeloyl-ACP methyl ester carboxylesterase
VFGDDLVALLDHLGVEQAVIGGTSMGAGVALNVAVRYPARVTGLVLSRPAWLYGPMPAENVARYAGIARLLRAVGAANDPDRALLRALAKFQASKDYRGLVAGSSDTAQSLLGQFTNERAVAAVARLERLPIDGPLADLGAAAAIRVPVVVLAHRQDPIHRFEFGERLARAIPGAKLVELTPKSIARERHAADVQGCLDAFLSRFAGAADTDRRPDPSPDRPGGSRRAGVASTCQNS